MVGVFFCGLDEFLCRSSVFIFCATSEHAYTLELKMSALASRISVSNKGGTKCLQQEETKTPRQLLQWQ
jgi:hypothetical protein